jgi:hypothetical protein
MTVRENECSQVQLSRIELSEVALHRMEHRRGQESVCTCLPIPVTPQYRVEFSSAHF